MTVTATSSRNVSTAAAGATVFPYGFKITDASHLLVLVDDEAKTLGTHYTVDGVGLDAGGDVTFLTPLTGGETVVRMRNMPYSRTTDFQNLGDLLSATLNNDQDAPVLMIQQLAEAIGRCLQISATSPAGTSGELPLLQPLAPLVVNAEGTGFAMGNTDLSGDMLLRADLASTVAGKGSVLVGFTQPGTGAAAQTLQAKARQSISLADYTGWDGTGVADSTAAFNNAVADAIATGVRRVRIPAGITRLNSKVTIALTGISSIALEGEGKSLSKILAASATGDGIEITRGTGNWWIDVAGSNQNAIVIRDLTVMANSLNIGTGIKISGGSTVGRPPAPITLQNVEVRAYSGINNQSFAIGVHLYNCGGATFQSCNFLCGGTSNLVGTGVKIECDTANMDFSGIFFNQCGFTYGNYGVQAGDRIEGVYFTNCAFVGMNNAVYWSATSESGFHFIGGHCNTQLENFILTGIYDICIQGALLYGAQTASKTSVVINGGGRQAITGCVFYGSATGAIGISVANGATGNQAGCTISGNQFTNFNTAISIASTGGAVHVGPNSYDNCPTRVSNSSATATVHKFSWQASTAPVLTGGGTSTTFNVSVPSGTFPAAPSVVVVTADGSSADYLCSYNSTASTATSIQVRVVRRDGGTIAAGAARFNIAAFE